MLVGGIAAAYALVDMLPPDVLTPPTACPRPDAGADLRGGAVLDLLTWAFGIPNSGSHCIPRVEGVAIADALLKSR